MYAIVAVYLQWCHAICLGIQSFRCEAISVSVKIIHAESEFYGLAVSKRFPSIIFIKQSCTVCECCKTVKRGTRTSPPTKSVMG